MEAQGLIQSAAPGVDTSNLEADRENLMDKWNSLNAKVSSDLETMYWGEEGQGREYCHPYWI